PARPRPAGAPRYAVADGARLGRHHLFRDELAGCAAAFPFTAAAEDAVDRHPGLRAPRAGRHSNDLHRQALSPPLTAFLLRISRIIDYIRAMIVCVCNRLTESEVRKAARAGATTPEKA